MLDFYSYHLPTVDNPLRASAMIFSSKPSCWLASLCLSLLFKTSESLADNVPTQTHPRHNKATVSSKMPLNNMPSSPKRRMKTSSRRSNQKHLYIPQRELTPPFPDGPCGGEIITLDPSLTFDIDVRLSGNTMLLPPRPIQVWLPPGYYDNDKSHKYPTLYCHDGQNVVSDASSWTGRSWRLPGALTRLAEHGLLRGNNNLLPIVVLLPCMEGDLIPGIKRRHLEYGDVNLPFAQAHADFVADTVKPLVDARFSTNPNTCYSIGSSLGGQAGV